VDDGYAALAGDGRDAALVFAPASELALKTALAQLGD
jgi:hypothetical protein